MSRSQQRGEETRAAILNAAANCFARHGYDGASVADLCRCAGVTKGAFYHHFASKQAVLLELLERWLSSLDAEFDAVRARSTSIPQALQEMSGSVGQVFVVAGDQLPMFLEFLTKAIREPEVWQAAIAPYRRYQDYFAGLIEAGVAEGTLESIDPVITAQALVSLAVGLVVQGIFNPQGTDWGHVTEESVRIFIKGLAKT